MGNIKEILDKLLQSETKLYILELYHKNPGLIDTEDGVARRIGSTADGITGCLKDLFDLGLIGKRKINKIEVFFLNRERDKEIQEALDNYIKGFDAGRNA